MFISAKFKLRFSATATPPRRLSEANPAVFV
jgi:hypothetical protein